MGFDHRESERKDSLNLLDYVVLDDSGNQVERAMARTLNVSERGILFETHLCLDKDQVLLVTIGLGNDLCEIRGKIVRADGCGDDCFRYGVEFLDITDKDAATLREFLREFKENNKQTT